MSNVHPWEQGKSFAQDQQKKRAPRNILEAQSLSDGSKCTR